MVAKKEDDGRELEALTKKVSAVDAHGEAIKKLAQSQSVGSKELAKVDAKATVAMARSNAVAKQVEQLMADHVSSADLKALEKRLIDMIKKVK